MQYNLHYRILSINYDDDTRVTRVGILNESTGEVFHGEARRNPNDFMSPKIGVQLATLRAVRKAMLQDLADDKSDILWHGSSLSFEY